MASIFLQALTVSFLPFQHSSFTKSNCCYFIDNYVLCPRSYFAYATLIFTF